MIVTLRVLVEPHTVVLVLDHLVLAHRPELVECLKQMQNNRIRNDIQSSTNKLTHHIVHLRHEHNRRNIVIVDHLPEVNDRVG